MVLKKLKNIKDVLIGRVNETITLGNDEGVIRQEKVDYIELEPKIEEDNKTAHLLVKYFILSDFADIKPVIDSLREGYTIAIVKYKPLGNKDSTELKRAISKIKRTIEAINGELMGMEDGWLVAVPQFVSIAKGKSEESSM